MLKPYVKAKVWLATRNKKRGQSLAEYGLILGLIAVVAIAALTAMGGQIQGILTTINGALGGAQGGMTPGGGGGG
jgi:pilus assembly protein Flp/PilA